MSQVFPELYNIRLATSEALLARGYLIYSWGLPMPTLPVYADHSQRVATADGGIALRGYPSFSLTWNRLSAQQARTLRKLVEDAIDASGVLWATIDLGWNNSATAGSWVDVYGVPHIPQTSPVGGTMAGAFDSVTLFVNNLTIDNNPASF
jgi:hypothetical protein